MPKLFVWAFENFVKRKKRKVFYSVKNFFFPKSLREVLNETKEEDNFKNKI